MATELKSLVLFLVFIFALSFFSMTERATSLHKVQPTYGNKIYLKEKQSIKNKIVTLSFDIKKDNKAKRNSSRSGFCKKTSGSIFDDMIVRNIDTTLHLKFFELRLHHFEYKKDAVYNNLFSCFASNCDIYIHPSDYYIYTLRKIIT